MVNRRVHDSTSTPKRDRAFGAAAFWADSKRAPDWSPDMVKGYEQAQRAYDETLNSEVAS